MRQSLLVLLTPFLFQTAHTQQLSPAWTQQVQINSYNLHQVGDSIALVGTNDDGLTELNVFDASGNLVHARVILEIPEIGSSIYDNSRRSFYLYGANDGTNILMAAQLKADGSFGWQKSLSFNNYCLPYQTAQQGDKLAFTYATLDEAGHSDGLGWWLLDTAGTLIKNNTYPLPVSGDYPEVPYATAFTPDGNLVIGLSNVINGECKILKFNTISGALLWEKPFNFNMFGTIQCIYCDATGNIYASGDNGFFVKLAPDGNLLFNKTMGYEDISIAHRIIEHNDAIYIFGDWREDFGNVNGKMIVGKYNKNDGNPDWIWISDFGGVDHGPGANDAYFKNDSTIILNFARLFESKWLGEFKINAATGTFLPLPATPIEISPNPAVGGRCRLVFPAEERGNIRISDMSGRTVREYSIAENVAVELPAAGLYVAEAKGKNTVYRGIIVVP